MSMSSSLLLCLVVSSLFIGCGSPGFHDMSETVEPVQERYVAPKNGLSNSTGGLGVTCAPGCVWSSFAVTIAAQEATHLCGSTECVCVTEGDVYTACGVSEEINHDAPESESNESGGLPGDSCGEGCLWSTYAVYIGAQSGSHLCQDAPCACVVNGDVWSECGDEPNVREPRPSEPPPAAHSGSDADQVLNAHSHGKMTLWNQTFGRSDGADPLSNIRDAAAGRPAQTSCYGGAPCRSVNLSSRLLKAMRDLVAVHGMNYFVTSIAGAAHSYGSLHYAGRAIDFDEVNGVLIRGDSAQARALMQACWALGASEVYGPSNDPHGHRDHVHCGW